MFMHISLCQIPNMGFLHWGAWPLYFSFQKLWIAYIGSLTIPVSPQFHQNLAIAINLHFLSADGAMLSVFVYFTTHTHTHTQNLLWSLAIFYIVVDCVQKLNFCGQWSLPVSLRSWDGNGKSISGLLGPQKMASRTLDASPGLALSSLPCLTLARCSLDSVTVHTACWVSLQFLKGCSCIHDGSFHELKTSPASRLSVTSTLNCT